MEFSVEDFIRRNHPPEICIAVARKKVTEGLSDQARLILMKCNEINKNVPEVMIELFKVSKLEDRPFLIADAIARFGSSPEFWEMFIDGKLQLLFSDWRARLGILEEATVRCRNCSVLWKTYFRIAFDNVQSHHIDEDKIESKLIDAMAVFPAESMFLYMWANLRLQYLDIGTASHHNVNAEVPIEDAWPQLSNILGRLPRNRNLWAAAEKRARDFKEYIVAERIKRLADVLIEVL